MSFFIKPTKKRATKAVVGGTSADTLHRLECRACPLDKARVKTPKMAPVGPDKAEVYLLGVAPGPDDDATGEPFSGDAGRLVRKQIPSSWKKRVRYGNTIRTMQPEDVDPAWVMTECCRPSVIRDIELAKPKAIIGFGNAPLKWATGEAGIVKMRGRSIPVKVGNHHCWYFPVTEPEEVIKAGINKKTGRPNKDLFKSDTGRTFQRDLKRVFKKVPKLEEVTIPDYEEMKEGISLIRGVTGDIAKVKSFLKRMCDEDIVGLDIEGNGLRPFIEGKKICSIAIGTFDEVLAIAVDHREAKWSKGDRKKLDVILGDFLTNSPCRKVCHKLDFEMEWFAHFYGNKLLRNTDWEDTMAQAYVLDERKHAHSLDLLCQIHFGFRLKDYNNLDIKRIDFEPLDDVLIYNGMDTKWTVELWCAQMDLVEEVGLVGVYDMQLKRHPTIVLTQQKGFLLDQKEVKRLQNKMAKKIKKLEGEIAGLSVIREYEKKSHQTFKPGSSDQLVVVLRDFLNVGSTINKEGSSKGYTTDKAVLDQIKHPLAQLIVDYRHATKLKSTYIDNFIAPNGTDVYDDGRAHSALNTMFTSTGRTSSEAPNQQNIPKHQDKWVRRQVIPPKGHALVSIDYGQVEARVIGMASEDKAFCDALWANYDIHYEWAERIAKQYPEAMDHEDVLGDMKNMRQRVKNKFVFPAFFGAAPYSIADYLSMPEHDCEILLKDFWNIFKGVAKWQKKLLNGYYENGYVETLTGRRRHAPISKNQIINMPIQGTASDIVIDAMDRLSEYAQAKNLWQFQAAMNIHDDLTFELPFETLEGDIDFAVKAMLAVPFDFVNVPISVEVEMSEYSWYEMEEVGTFATND